MRKTEWKKRNEKKTILGKLFFSCVLGSQFPPNVTNFSLLSFPSQNIDLLDDLDSSISVSNFGLMGNWNGEPQTTINVGESIPVQHVSSVTGLNSACFTDYKENKLSCLVESIQLGRTGDPPYIYSHPYGKWIITLMMPSM